MAVRLEVDRAPAAPGRSPRPAGLEPRRIAWMCVAALTIVGVALRIVVATQSLYGDELATYWDVTQHSLGGLISALHGTHIEITPPLFFIAAWFTSHLGHAPLLLRLPSLAAGVLTIPLVYTLGCRTVGRRAALVATALTALSPFMVYYSAEARAYGLMMLLTSLSTLSMLRALETGRRVWWGAYAACACAAAYSHYTCAFYLLGQFLWVLWAHPQARRPALVASVAAAAGLLPWASAIVNAENSPTTKIMSDLSPFNLDYIRIYLEHWLIGHPYPGAGPVTGLPGTFALVLLALAFLVVLAGVLPRLREAGALASVLRDRPTMLVVVLLVSVPVGEALQSLGGTHVFGVRNLAASWPPLALVAGALLVAPGPRLRLASCGLALVAFAIGGLQMARGGRWARPDVQGAATYIAHEAHPGDVVIDSAEISPGPLTAFDVALHRPLLIFRAGLPQERDHPFAFADPKVTLAQAIDQAVAAARGHRIMIVSTVGGGLLLPGASLPGKSLPGGYRRQAQRELPGLLRTVVQVYGTGAPAAG